MRRYSRMTVGLLVLFSLLQLSLTAGRSLFQGLRSVEVVGEANKAFSSPSIEFQETGARLLLAGEEKAQKELASVWEERITLLLRTVSGREDLQGVLIRDGGRISGAKILYNSGKGYPEAVLQKLVGELLGVDPKKVEVEKTVEADRSQPD